MSKFVTVYGLLARTEASYNAATTLSSGSHGVLLSAPAQMQLDYIHDGARGQAPGAAGQLRRGAPSGLSGQVELTVEGRGRSTALSSSNLPEIDPLMKMSGHAATVVNTSGSQSVTYAPIATDFTSSAMALYSRGQVYTLGGGYANMSWEIDGPAYMMFNFAAQGIVGLPTDVSVPSITYDSIVPPKAESVALTIGAWSGAVVRSAEFNANRVISPRADINSGGHAGFAMGALDPELTITIEAVALTTFNPYEIRDLATAQAISLTVGSVQYNKVQFSAPNAQLVGIEESEDDSVATWTLSYRLTPTSPISSDDYSIKFF